MSHEKRVFKDDGTKTPKSTSLLMIYIRRGRVAGVLTVTHYLLYSVSICTLPVICDHSNITELVRTSASIF